MTEILTSATDTRGVTTLTLNRPAQRNALDADLIETLIEHFEALRIDTTIRVVVLTGAGDTFCAGADLRWMQEMAHADEPANLRSARLIGDLMHVVSTAPQVTVARIQGHTFGGGAGLVAACDIAVAVAHAEMSFSEVRLGLVPAMISPVVVAAIGARATRRLFLTGERFSALEALRLGLVHDVVEADNLDAAVERFLQMLLAGGPEALRACKRLLAHDVERTDPETLAAALACLRASDEGHEGLAAFLEKRQPRWLKP